MNILPGMNAGASTYAVPSPIKGSGTAWVLLGSWALSPARPTPIHLRHECRGLSALFGEEEEQPLFGRRQGAGLLDGQLAGGPGCPIEAPRGPMRLERRLEGRNEGLKRVEGHAGAIQELRWVGPSVSAPSTRHRRCLLSLEIQQIINRDKL